MRKLLAILLAVGLVFTLTVTAASASYIFPGQTTYKTSFEVSKNNVIAAKEINQIAVPFSVNKQYSGWCNGISSVTVASNEINQNTGATIIEED